MRASIRGTFGRCAGMALWWMADPTSLPPALGQDRAAEALPPNPIRKVNKAVGSVLMVAAVSMFVAGDAARRHVEELRVRYETPPDYALTRVAAELAAAADGGWWSWFYPGIRRRTLVIAEQVETGRVSLVRAADEYSIFADRMATLSLPGRMLRGPEASSDLAEALALVDGQWHQNTRPFLRMQKLADTYRMLQDRAFPIRGTVTAAPAGHGIQFAALDDKGTVRNKTVGLGIRDEFEVRLYPGGTIRLSDAVERGNRLDVVTSRREEIPAAEWSEVPAEGSILKNIRVRFDPKQERLAPVPEPLSAALLATIAATGPKEGS